jgi:hypothetical protein
MTAANNATREHSNSIGDATNDEEKALFRASAGDLIYRQLGLT